MGEVTWTRHAVDDLDGIAEYIASDSPHFASLFVIDLIAAVERAAEFPMAGRVVPEARDANIRESLLGNYRIIYRSGTDRIEILTIYHSARLLDPRRIQ